MAKTWNGKRGNTKKKLKKLEKNEIYPRKNSSHIKTEIYP